MNKKLYIVIYCSDLHSNILNFKKIILKNFSTNESPNINYIFTGDYINKGISEISTFLGSLINIIITCALNSSKNKSNFIFLKGNHEDINAIERNNLYLFKLLKSIDLFDQKKNIFEKIYPITNFNFFKDNIQNLKLILESHHGQMLDKLSEKIDLNQMKNFMKVKIEKDEQYLNYLYCWSDFSRLSLEQMENKEKNARPEITFEVLKDNICRNLNINKENVLKLTINGHTHNENVNILFEKLLEGNICLVKNNNLEYLKNSAPGFFNEDYISSKEFYEYINKDEKNIVGLFLPCSCGLNDFGKSLKIESNLLKNYFNTKFKKISGTLGYLLNINEDSKIEINVIDLENEQIIEKLN